MTAEGQRRALQGMWRLSGMKEPGGLGLPLSHFADEETIAETLPLGTG